MEDEVVKPYIVAMTDAGSPEKTKIVDSEVSKSQLRANSARIRDAWVGFYDRFIISLTKFETGEFFLFLENRKEKENRKDSSQPVSLLSLRSINTEQFWLRPPSVLTASPLPPTPRSTDRSIC